MGRRRGDGAAALCRERLFFGKFAVDRALEKGYSLVKYLSAGVDRYLFKK